MELEEAKERLKDLYKSNSETISVLKINNSDVKTAYKKENEAIDTVIAELHAMQNLLDEKNEEIDRLQKENEKYISGELMTRNQAKHFEEITNKHYIHKNKIREKIEELECTIIKGRRNNARYFDNIARACAMRVLQDLLKEE